MSERFDADLEELMQTCVRRLAAGGRMIIASESGSPYVPGDVLVEGEDGTQIILLGPATRDDFVRYSPPGADTGPVLPCYYEIGLRKAGIH